MIFLEGDESVGLWFVLRGRVKIIKQSLGGRVQGICVMNRGKCFGSCPLFNTDENPASAQALDNVDILILPDHYLKNVTEQDPELADILLQIFSQRLEHLARLSEGLGAWAVPDRINDCLLTYADYTHDTPTVTLTHEKLADLAGTAREVVTRHLTRLEEKGVIQTAIGKIFLLDPDSLKLPCILDGE
ncbi:MAG: Crp/Fnr family transcriptional regulator [Chloroflexi bacterium]|nr:MAG: Crp/Fnr family transcriptional regulator [Chloroflexota bacterium]